MTEPRMRARTKGQQFATAELEAYLVAFGDDHQPLPETVKVLDEIITDFIIETCHSAALSAAYSHRAKIKLDDFKFALRKDPRKLGRVTELLALDKDLRSKRKAFEVEEGVVAKGEGKRGKGEKGEKVEKVGGKGKRGRKAKEKEKEKEEDEGVKEEDD